MSADLTAEQQLDILWWALKSSQFWMSANVDDSIVLSENPGGGQIGRVMHQFKGTRAEIMEQLVGLRVADRLDGISHDLIPGTPNVRDQMKNTFIG